MPHPVGGYVLAGGKSSRMGRDKALVELAGKPLLLHAVEKLRRVCADVHVLSANPDLASYAPILPDLHPGCGPMGGMEAALAHSPYPWNLFLAVDMPFVPSSFLEDWVQVCLQAGGDGARVRLFEADGRPQPGLCLLHRDLLPFISAAIERGAYKLMPVLVAAARDLAEGQGFRPEDGLAQKPADPQWFANLNTPEDLAEAERKLVGSTSGAASSLPR